MLCNVVVLLRRRQCEVNPAISCSEQGLFSAPTLQPAAVTVVMMSCVEKSNPSLQVGLACLPYSSLLLVICCDGHDEGLAHRYACVC